MSYLINSLLICAWFLLSSISLLEAVDCGIHPAYCDSSSVLYQIDGSCNNLLHPEYGTPNTTYDRLLPAQYGDGIKSPRKSTTGADLPNARSIRLNCLPHDKLILETTLTKIAVAVGQFAAHDISRQVLNAPVDACCSSDLKLLTNPPDYCAAVELCPDDPVFGELNATCMPAQCSKTNQDYQCSLTHQAEQITETTGYLDLSDLYSESAAKLNELRSYQDGKLILVVRNDNEYLQIDSSNDNCYIPQGSAIKCLYSGDPEVNQNPSLSIINTMWFREHNRLCDKLKYYNPCWNDEKLFQIARRINIAIHQWMIYFEFLPLILGSITVQTTGIAPISLGYNDDYDATVKVNPYNEFSHAAYRVLHPLIRGTVHLRDEARQDAGAAYLPDLMEHTQEFIENGDNFDSIIRGDSYGNAFKVGSHQDFIISNSLFLRNFKHNLDLIVQDIVRGRCNGLPSYNDLLAYCNCPRASTFDDLLNYMDAKDVAALSAIYASVNDVDGIVGMRNEKRLLEGIVGPVTSCILIKQFQKTRRGDRLFFEHPEAKFNLLQLNSIRLSSKLSTFLCNNGNNIKTMQPNAFEEASLLNVPVACELLPQLDLSLWKDYSCI